MALRSWSVTWYKNTVLLWALCSSCANSAFLNHVADQLQRTFSWNLGGLICQVSQYFSRKRWFYKSKSFSTREKTKVLIFFPQKGGPFKFWWGRAINYSALPKENFSFAIKLMVKYREKKSSARGTAKKINAEQLAVEKKKRARKMAHPSPHSKINGAWRKSVNVAKSVSGHKTK